MITEKELVIEAKGFSTKTVKNRLKIVMASNEDWVVPAGPEARRFAVFNVSDKYCFNGELSEGVRQTYFDALITQMKSGGIEAMSFDLLRRDLSGYHPSIILSNKALAEQKQLTMEPLASWWYDMVERGEYSMGGPVIKERNVVSSESLLSVAKDYDPVLERTLNPQVLGRFLSSTLRVSRRVAERFRESFPEGGGNFYTVRRMPRH